MDAACSLGRDLYSAAGGGGWSPAGSVEAPPVISRNCRLPFHDTKGIIYP